jgi:NAD+ kinase
MKIALFPNFERAGTTQLLPEIINILTSSGAKCYTFCGANIGLEEKNQNQLYDECDVILTVGGDGTLIKQAKAAASYLKPCLGINTGRLGFLTNIEKDNLNLLKKLAFGDFKTESRMMLSVKVIKKGQEIYKGTALNDVVISSGTVSKITDIKLTVSGDEIDYRADGIIISTPTGSTAYSMSAGGPIIDPDMRCITVTPICSHSLTARPMILHEKVEITAGIMDSSRTTAFLTVDGDRAVEVDFDTQIVVSSSNLVAKLANISGSTIYQTISLKF